MRTTIGWRMLGILGVAATLACGPGGEGGTGSSSSGAACDPAAARYLLLGAGHDVGVAGWLTAFAEIHDVRKGNTAPPFEKADFAQIESIYDASLAAAVQGISGGPAWEPVDAGAAMDALIVAAIARGKDSQDATDIDELGQLIEKTLVRFLYLAMHRSMTVGADQARGWDEAFTLYGRSADGTVNEFLADEVAEYDADLSLAQNAKVFAALVAGRCAVLSGDAAARAAQAAAAEEAVRSSFAYAAGKYFKALSEGSMDRVQLAEGAMWFNIAEPWMRAHGKAAEADTVRNWLTPLLPGGAMATQPPDTAGAAAALAAMRSAYALTL
ncbi:MAG: hypothetical protein HY904_11700 [Deltaproteobacteria bacterium]|nr:hypothetical protein [Deltaproteobacteria bacterium]